MVLLSLFLTTFESVKPYPVRPSLEVFSSVFDTSNILVFLCLSKPFIPWKDWCDCQTQELTSTTINFGELELDAEAKSMNPV